MHIGGGVTSVNLACSGARTYSRISDGKFKPGIDFYSSGANKGQALALQEYARTTHNIKAVVVLIGANDYGFADIVQTCVTELADLALVVEELLPGRREHGRDVLGGEHQCDHAQRAQRLHQRQARR